jgi:hypothetical protein
MPTPTTILAPTRRGRGKSQRSLDLIDAAYNILAEIKPASIRAVCYRLFVAGIITDMSKAETSRVSVQLTYAREQGIIPWEWIVDETREVERTPQWSDAAAYGRCIARSYRRNRWTDQPRRVEVWSEKGTIRGTLAPVLERYGLAFRVMHGYGSATALHDAAVDSDGDKILEVLYLGDWDPSGLHMSEIDIPTRIEKYDGYIEIDRLAITEADTKAAGLPSFDAKTKQGDKRYRWFRERYGARCWELDALNPVLLRERVEDAVLDRLEPDAWERAEVVERAEQDSIRDILGNWPTAKSISGRAKKYPDGAR